MKHLLPRLFRLLVSCLLFFLFSYYAMASPECPIVTGRFPQANGTTVDNSSTGWYLDASQVASTAIFSVKSNRLTAQELGGEGRWYSNVFSVAGYSSFQVAVKITSEGDMNSSEYVKIYYKVNGGTETLLDQRTGNFGTIDFTSPALTGNNVQLIVKIYNYNNGGSQTSKYYIEEYRVFKEKGPCANTISVSATAGNSGVLTCTNSSLTLSASSSGTGVTYSWTGPNGFTSTEQNPSVSTEGTYTVTGTSSAGTGSATVTVTANKAAPDLTATGGSLGCTSTTTLNAVSSVAGITYKWSGPNSFSSTVRNPTVSVAGSYTVVITNPANGCTAQQTVQVTGTAPVSNFWVENFTLSNNTTSDNGSTPWTIQTSGTGPYNVTNNEFRITNSGSSGQCTWTSGSISLTNKANINISIGARCSTTDGGVLNNDGSAPDYLRFYYKLNGGSEVMFKEFLGAINNYSTTNTTVSVGPLTGGGTLQIIVRARATGADEFYYFDNVTVSGSDVSPLTVTPSVTGTATCTGTAQLSATASSAVTTYAWTGPNGFTSSIQNPAVSVGGQYTVTVTSAAGCTASAPVTVTENKQTPDLTATGGSLVCLTSITLNANSSVANAQYSWTGPNSFSSTSKNPSVSATGTYTAKVTNPANGCYTTQAVQVTTALSSDFWLEDFTAANGTTDDNGTTAWSIENPGSGTFSVQSNEFKASFNSGNEGRWLSEVIDISSKTNVVFSVNLRSETPSSNDHFESDDYIRVYYKLNGGAEVLVYDDAAGIGTTTSGTASVLITSAALNGTSLQIIVKARNSSSTERYYFDNVKVTGNESSNITAVATATGSLTCAATSVTLTGSSSAIGATYSWTGPGFTSTAQNPSVTATGVYTLVVTNPSTGCTATDTALVTANTNGPDASVVVNGSLSCNNPSIVLTGNSSVTGATYSWTGPNGFTAAVKSPSATASGTYFLTVFNPANGCSTTTSGVLSSLRETTGNLWVEDFTLSNNTTVDSGATAWTSSTTAGTFSVNSNTFRVSGTTTATGSQGVWTSGTIAITGKTNVTISADVRSAISEGGLMNETGSNADFVRFYYKLNGGAEVLFAEKLGAINNHSTTYTPVTIGGLSGTSVQIVIRARATGTDEFYYIDNVKVIGNTVKQVNALATAASAISCSSTTATINGSSTTSGATFSWSGPGGFTATTQNATVTAPGTYTLTATDPVTGCTAIDTALVTQSLSNLWLEDFTLSNNTASDGGATSWTTSAPAGSTFSVNSNTFRVSGITTATGSQGVWTSGTIAITGKTNVTISADVRSAVSEGGLMNDSGSNADYIRFYYKLNGGAEVLFAEKLGAINNHSTTYTPVSISGLTGSSVQIVIRARATGTDEFYYVDNVKVAGVAQVDALATANGTISCGNSELQLSGNTTITGATYRWTGPSGFVSTVQNPSVSTTGVYTLVVTDPVTGCTGTDTALVAQALGNLWVEDFTLSNNTTVDAGATAWTSTTTAGTFSVNSNTFRVSGTTTATGSEGVWTSGTIDITGKVNVNINADVRSAISEGGLMNETGSNADYVRFYYKLNNGSEVLFAEKLGAINNHSTTYTPVAVSGLSGTVLQIVIRARATGTDEFYYIDNVKVLSNLNNSTITALASANTILTCVNKTVPLSGSADPAGVTYSWTGPNNFTATTQNPSVSVPGIYTLTVTQPGGCSAIDTALVLQNISVPQGVSASAVPVNANTLTCTQDSVYLGAGSTTPFAQFTWAGPNGYTAATSGAVVRAPGQYKVLVAHPATGCTVTDSVMVYQNTTPPANVVATTTGGNNGVLTCTATSVTLTGSSTTSGVTYGWTGPGNVNVTTPVLNATAAGSYLLTVTNPVNGCKVERTTQVSQNIAPPDGILAFATGKITCNNTSITLQGSSASANATYLWTGPNSFSVGQASAITTKPGLYTLKVTAAGNGCSGSTDVYVDQDIAPPDAITATANGALSCLVSSVDLVGNTTTTTTLNYVWIGPDGVVGFTPTVSVGAPGVYTLIITNQGNGCSAQDTAEVVFNFDDCFESARKAPATATTANAEDAKPLTVSTGKFESRVYPNPFTAQATVEFVAPQQATVTTGIYNSIGVLEQWLFNGKADANKVYKLSLNGSKLSTGVHYCIIRVDGKVYTHKLVLIK